MKLSADIRDLLQTPACPVCDQTSVDVIYPAAYPAGATREAIISVYCSSSDQSLMDRLVRCTGCGLVYTSPRIKDDVIHASYSEAVDPVFITQNELRIATFRRSLGAICSELGVTPSRGHKVLDVGCAGGAFVKAAQDAGFSATGVEPSRWLAEKAKEIYGIDVRPGMLSDHQFPERSFSFVSLWDVIEHLTDPGRELDSIHRILADDGYLIVNYPDFGSLSRRMLQRSWPFLLSVHLFYFTRNTIQALLKRHGFEAILFRRHTQTLELGYTLERAGRIIPLISPVARFVKALGLGRLPLRYSVGQALLIARKVRS